MDDGIPRNLHARPIAGAAFEYPGGILIDPHRHSAHQLIYAMRGVMRVLTTGGAWVVPPNRALWVPADGEHAIRTVGAVSMRTLYVQRGLRTKLPQQYAVMGVSPLLRELILRLIDVQTNGEDRSREGKIIAVVLDELRTLEAQPLSVALPRDPRLREICEAIQADPGSNETSTDWAARFGISGKTLERDFAKSLGMSFGQWRQQVRLLASLERLATGDPITAVALDLGYRSPSAFTAMFRRALGSTPGKYFSDFDKTLNGST